MISELRKIIVAALEEPKRVPGLDEKELHGMGCRPIDRDECFSYRCARWIEKSPVGPGCAEKVTALLLADMLGIITEREFNESASRNMIEALLQEFKKKGGDIDGRTFEGNRGSGANRGSGNNQGCEPPVSSGHSDGLPGEGIPGIDGEALEPIPDGTGVQSGGNRQAGEQDRPALETMAIVAALRAIDVSLRNISESDVKIASFLKDNIDYSLQQMGTAVVETLFDMNGKVDNIHIAIQDCVELFKEKGG